MGVDYDAVGGIGIKVTDDYLKTLGYDKEKDEMTSFLDNLGIVYEEYGDCYTDDSINYVWIVPGKKYLECVKNIPSFLHSLNEKGIKVSEEDLEIIEELFVW